MLSYQHAYNAGGTADLHKHVVLVTLLAPLAGTGLTYVESHAGRGLYDLAAPEAEKTGEAAAGLGRLAAALPDGPPDGPFWNVLLALRDREGPEAYPGSPAVAATLLEPGDRLSLYERHPAEYRALGDAQGRLDARGRGRRGPRVWAAERDGHAGVRALRGAPGPLLALIDPSYEVKDEYGEAARTALAAFSGAGRTVVVWYPLLPAGLHAELVTPVVEIAGPASPGVPWRGCLRSEVGFVVPPARGMTGSGLLILGPPPGAAEAMAAALAPLAPICRPTLGPGA
ncbi:MAG: 23S rRNA (adenine(2030)-N(6))-methyltransferase RlmJ [Pseudomonadota bacterium]